MIVRSRVVLGRWNTETVSSNLMTGMKVYRRVFVLYCPVSPRPCIGLCPPLLPRSSAKRLKDLQFQVNSELNMPHKA